MTEIARESGLSREHLYRSFSENGNPTLKSILAVMGVLGVRLTATTQKRDTRVAAKAVKRASNPSPGKRKVPVIRKEGVAGIRKEAAR